MSTTLDAWIQPGHLTDTAIERYREAFTSHPARLLVLEDLLLDDQANRLADFLRADAQYEARRGLYSSEDVNVAEADWQAAPDEDRFFRFSQLVGIAPEAQLSSRTLAYMQFRSLFAQPDVQDFFQAITDLSLAYSQEDIGVHAMHPGDFLRSHDDNNRERQLAMVLYLTPEWKPEYGGRLHVVEPGGNVTPIDATYNSMVIFDVRSGATHQVEPVTAAAEGTARRTIGGWYQKGG